MAEKKFVDWELIERDYRAGIKTLRQIAEERGVSHVAINKRAKKDGWSRDLTQKIQQKAQELVTKAEVTKAVTKERAGNDRDTVSAYGGVLADVEIKQREGVQLGIDNAFGILCELSMLAKPEFREVLEWMADEFDESNPTFKDKANELYRYIIGLAGRVKMGKDAAATLGVYYPLQRKQYKLDDEGNNKTTVDDLLEAIGA